MKVLLLAHPNSIESGMDRDWLQSFHESGSRGPVTLHLFRPDQDKFADFDLVHAFGFLFADLLANLRPLGKLTLLTPHFRPLPARTYTQECIELALRTFRAISQRRLDPRDAFHNLRNMDRYLLLPQQEQWALSWRIPAERCSLLPADPVAAAQAALPAYRALWGNR
jgi:hypothetical protein